MKLDWLSSTPAEAENDHGLGSNFRGFGDRGICLRIYGAGMSASELAIRHEVI